MVGHTMNWDRSSHNIDAAESGEGADSVDCIRLEEDR